MEVIKEQVGVRWVHDSNVSSDGTILPILFAIFDFVCRGFYSNSCNIYTNDHSVNYFCNRKNTVFKTMCHSLLLVSNLFPSSGAQKRNIFFLLRSPPDLERAQKK